MKEQRKESVREMGKVSETHSDMDVGCIGWSLLLPGLFLRERIEAIEENQRGITCWEELDVIGWQTSGAVKWW